MEKGGAQKMRKRGAQKMKKGGAQKLEKGGAQPMEKGGAQKMEKSGAQKMKKGGAQKWEKGGAQKMEKSGAQQRGHCVSSSPSKQDEDIVFVGGTKHMEKGGAQQKGHLGSSSTSKQAENIVLVGRTGNGKSATGNSLIGKRVFVSKAHASGVTMECEKHEAVIGDGQRIIVIDTPGLSDFSGSTEYISREIVRCLTLAEGGIHAVLLVLSAKSRITQEEENTFLTLQALFGSKILDYVIFVFTCGDMLEESGETLEDYLGKDCPPFVKEAMRMSGNRMILFDNKTHDEGKKADQVHKLLSLVDEIRKANRGEAYTNDLYHDIKVETDILNKKYGELQVSNNLSKEQENQLHARSEEIMKRQTSLMEKKLKTAMEALERAHVSVTNHVREYGPPDCAKPNNNITLSVPFPTNIPGINGFPCSIL